MLCNLSKMESDKLIAVQQLEKELGKSLIAYTCHDIGMADLSKNELAKIQMLENKLAISLVAVKA